MPPKGSQPTLRRLPSPVCSSGVLSVVGMPIGHPDDITIRALHVLRAVSIIASENPQATQALLTHHGITACVTSYGPSRLAEKVPLLLHRLTQGQNVALVSDCGMPVILDPGHLLVKGAHALHIPVRVVPGPSALTAALAVSGFAGDTITIEGPVPHGARALSGLISRLKPARNTVVLYSDSRSLPRLLRALAAHLPTRESAIALNLTKPDEMIRRGTASQLLEDIARLHREVDVTLVIEGR